MADDRIIKPPLGFNSSFGSAIGSIGSGGVTEVAFDETKLIPLDEVKTYNPLEIGEDNNIYIDKPNDILYVYRDGQYRTITKKDKVEEYRPINSGKEDILYVDFTSYRVYVWTDSDSSYHEISGHWRETRLFIKVDDAQKEDDSDIPSLDTIKQYMVNNNSRNVIAYWNDTNDIDIPPICVYYVDNGYDVVTVESPSDEDTNTFAINDALVHIADGDLIGRTFNSFVGAVGTTLNANLFSLPNPEDVGSFIIVRNDGQGFVNITDDASTIDLLLPPEFVGILVWANDQWNNASPYQKKPTLRVVETAIKVSSDYNAKAKELIEITTSTENLNITLPDNDENDFLQGDHIIIKNIGTWNTVVKLSDNSIVEVIEPTYSYKFVWNGSEWVNVTAYVVQKITDGQITINADGVLTKNHHVWVTGGETFSFDENADNGTYWKVTNAKGLNSFVTIEEGGVAKHQLRAGETLIIFKENDTLLYTPLRQGGLTKYIDNQNYIIPDHEAVTLYECQALTSNTVITLPDSSIYSGRITIKSSNCRKHFHVKVQTNGVEAIWGWGADYQYTIGLFSSVTFEPNHRGNWTIVESHTVEDRRTNTYNPLEFGGLHPNIVEGSFYITPHCSTNRRRLWGSNSSCLPMAVEGMGVNNRCIGAVDQNNKYYAYSQNMNNHTFAFSTWLRVDEIKAESSCYFFGRNSTVGERSKVLHIGWRTRNQFTIAFWGNDVSFDVEPHLDVVNLRDSKKWIHFGMKYDAGTKRSTCWFNGVQVNRSNMPFGNYVSTWDMIMGSTGANRMGGFFSNVRFYIDDAGNTSRDWDMGKFWDLERPFFTGEISEA